MYTYPYSCGLSVGSRFELSVGNINFEKIDVNTIATKKFGVLVPGRGQDGASTKDESNCIICPTSQGTFLLDVRGSYCRGYASDYIWNTIKGLIIKLNKVGKQKKI